MTKYSVTLPIAGFAVVDVEAENAQDALELAHNEVTNEHIQEWESLNCYNSGNVCHCPSPWEAHVTNEETGNDEPVKLRHYR